MNVLEAIYERKSVRKFKDEVVPKLVKAMEKAASVFCKSLPIPAEPATGLHWIH